MKKKTIALLSRLFPRMVVNMAYKQLNNPQVRKNRPHELAVLQKAQQSTFPFSGFDIQTYAWGEGTDLVLLVHGWEGQAGNFADLIDPLVGAGYKVLGFDAPAHGFSSRKPTSLFDFINLVGQMLDTHRPQKVVSHSFGGVAVTYALAERPQLCVEKYVLFTTPDKFSERIDYVAAQTGITEKVKVKLINKIERETGPQVAALSVSDFVQTACINEALILHDRADQVISIAQSRRVDSQWPQSELKEFEGTGHFRLLRDPATIQAMIDFLA